MYISCPSIGVRAIFCQGGGGGGKPFAQKTLASCPNFYNTVEQKRGPYDATCLNSYHAGAWHYRIFPDFLKSPVSKWRIVRVKTRTKPFVFEEILINIPSENLPKLSKERMQYFCHALKLNLRSRHSADSAASASNCSMNRSLEPKMTINFRQQRILCLILPASVL